MINCNTPYNSSSVGTLQNLKVCFIAIGTTFKWQAPGHSKGGLVVWINGDPLAGSGACTCALRQILDLPTASASLPVFLVLVQSAIHCAVHLIDFRTRLVASTRTFSGHLQPFAPPTLLPEQLNRRPPDIRSTRSIRNISHWRTKVKLSRPSSRVVLPCRRY